METAQTLEQVARSIQDLKTKIDLKKTLERLDKNKDFKRLIRTNYLQDYAVRLVHLTAHPGIASVPAEKAHIDTQLNAIGGLNQFLLYVMREGANAEDRLEGYEEEYTEMLREADEEDADFEEQ